jgi:DNA-binding MarR family transcriptional regulator
MPPPPKLDLELCATARDTCTAHNLRKATRAITILFDEALRPVGLRISQLSVLVAVSLAGEGTVSKLARMLGLDRTSLTRNLAPLERRGLIETVGSSDARRRGLRLTGEGAALLARALPVWRRTQRRVVAGLGDRRWSSLMQGLSATAGLSRQFASRRRRETRPSVG